MPNFTAKIRLDHTDIDGLILDCGHSDLADDGSLWVNRAPPARAVRTGEHTGADGETNLFDSNANWRTNQLVGYTIYNVSDGSSAIVTSNTQNQIVASLSGGTDNDWDNGNEYILATPRFGNPYQDVTAEQPVVSTVGGYKQAAFTRVNSSNFKLPLTHSILANELTVAFDFFHGASTANQQTVIGFPIFYIQRRNSSGNFEYRTDSVYRWGSGDMSDGMWLFTYLSATSANLLNNNSSELSDTAAVVYIAAGDPAGRIGSIHSGAQYCDMAMRSMRIWDRMLSPLEVDLAYKTISPETEYHALDRADMERRIWTDDTLSVSRINPAREASHKFICADLGGDDPARIQIAAQVDGRTRPDSELGGELFDITPVEIPCSANPAVYQDSGWSSVFDIIVEDEGHYTYCLSRSNGGSIILHFDVEAGM